jgi:type II secretory pathway pseudopilin PulG
MRRDRGAVLLEVVAALTIFALAAVSALSFLAQLTDTTARSQAVERRLADEDRLLTVYSLLTRPDLDRRLGRRAVGPYVVEVQRPRPEIYRVSVGDSAAPDLVTLLLRPEPAGVIP